MNFIEQLQTRVDWNRVFGVVDSLYSDKGFTSNADNFARATMVEKALDKFSDINRVDQNGYDFEWQDQKIELKMGKNLFYKRKDINATKKLKEVNGLRIFGEAKNKISVISFNIESIHPYDLGSILDKMGIAVRTGQHCAQPVMDFYQIPGTVRVSFSFYNTKKEIDFLILAINKAIKMLS